MNDVERAEFVENDEGLYNMWKSSKKSLRLFVKENRAFIDRVNANINLKKHPPHYLEYGVYGLGYKQNKW